MGDKPREWWPGGNPEIDAELEREVVKIDKEIDTFPEDVKTAFDHSHDHRSEVLASEKCGCFHCYAVFDPVKISEWTDDGETALCPKCQSEAVIGSGSSFPIDRDFLQKMHKYWS